MSDSPISVRRATEADLVFIRSSWFHSALKGFYRNKDLSFAFYRAGMNHVQDYLLKRSLAYVAFASEMPTEIIGYAVLEGNACHWVYTKGPFRRQGVARALLRRSTIYTHPATGAGKQLFEALKLNYVPQAAEPK